jgi:hypothetical protein
VPPQEENHSGLQIEEYGAGVLRLDPVEPSPPRIARRAIACFQARPAAPAPGRHAGEAGEWGRGSRQPVMWLALAGLATAAMVVGAMTLLPSINQKNDGRPGALQLVVATEDEVEGAEGLAAMYQRQAEAADLFAAYATADSIERRLPLLRDAAVIEPLLRATEAAPLAPAGWHPDDAGSWDAFDAGGRTCGLLTGMLPGRQPFGAYFVKVWGHLLIDWKATTGYGSATFAELEQGQGNPAEIRGFISAGTFYHPLFPESDHRCFYFSAPVGVQGVWCYAPRGSAVEAAIDRVLGSGLIVESSTRPEKITLRLERPPAGAMPNQWLIGEMLHKDWISP